MSFEYWPHAWSTRLEIMRDVFPWITEEIKKSAGLSPDDDLSLPESAKAFILAHSEYSRGGNSTEAWVAELHRRHSNQWELITGVPPLGTPDDWRAAGHASGAPAQAIQDGNPLTLARFIKPWAIAKRASLGSEGTAVAWAVALQCLTGEQIKLVEAIRDAPLGLSYQEILRTEGAVDEIATEPNVRGQIKRIRDAWRKNCVAFEIPEIKRGGKLRVAEISKKNATET